GLTYDGRLLVAGDAADRYGRAEEIGVGGAELGCGVAHLGQDRTRDAEDAQQLRVPCLLPDIEEQRPRGIRDLGRMHFAAGQVPQQPAVDGAEGKPALLGPRARALDRIEEPGELRGREVGIEEQAGALRDLLLEPIRPELSANVRGTPVLPDDGGTDVLICFAICQQRLLTLIGDAATSNL